MQLNKWINDPKACNKAAIKFCKKKDYEYYLMAKNELHNIDIANLKYPVNFTEFANWSLRSYLCLQC